MSRTVAEFLRSRGAALERKTEDGLVRRRIAVLTCLLLFLPFLPTRNFSSQARGGTMPLQISSTAFSAGETIRNHPQKIYL